MTYPVNSHTSILKVVGATSILVSIADRYNFFAIHSRIILCILNILCILLFMRGFNHFSKIMFISFVWYSNDFIVLTTIIIIIVAIPYFIVVIIDDLWAIASVIIIYSDLRLGSVVIICSSMGSYLV